MTVLEGIELRRLDLSLRAAVGTAAGPHLGRPLLLARVVTSRGDGWGECGALGSGTGTDPSIDDILPIVQSCASQLVDRGDGSPAAAALAAGDRPAARMTHALFEMALLDAALRADGRSLAAHLSAESAVVPVGAMVGIPQDRDLGALVSAVDFALDASGGGATRLRLKIAPGWDVEPVTAVRDRYPDLPLQVDANGAYSVEPDGGAPLQALDAFGLTCIEQPLPVHDLEGHARLAHSLATPIALDESLSSVARVAAAIEARAMTVACLKPSRLGGLRSALDALNLCTRAGCRAFVGGLFESGLGRSANAAVAARAGFDLPGDLTSPVGYLSAQPFGYPTVHDGTVAVPDGPGIGATLDRDVLDRLTVSAKWFGKTAA